MQDENHLIMTYVEDIKLARKKLLTSVGSELEELSSNISLVKVETGEDSTKGYCLISYRIDGYYQFPAAIRLRGLEFFYQYRNEKSEVKESDTFRDLEHLIRNLGQTARSIFNKRGHRLAEELGLFD